MTAMTKTRRPAPPRGHGVAALAGLAVPTGLLWLTVPPAALTVTLAEVVLAAIIVLTALFGPEHVSDRAFRILSAVTGQARAASGRSAGDVG